MRTAAWQHAPHTHGCDARATHATPQQEDAQHAHIAAAQEALAQFPFVCADHVDMGAHDLINEADDSALARAAVPLGITRLEVGLAPPRPHLHWA